MVAPRSCGTATEHEVLIWEDEGHHVPSRLAVHGPNQFAYHSIIWGVQGRLNKQLSSATMTSTGDVPRGFASGTREGSRSEASGGGRRSYRRIATKGLDASV